ncbi:Glutathione transport system permease protein GsiD [Granulosicoccus antarcticus IMCC3135]|uniref:Glutathione transport system permease protein GsiD n=2 Tax=Granulosicoccus TaxID=437504 RepID=A0A2Z2NYE2_9GAMM|nr:Glutathione transport system permease protein GsiD [Granulosicoccus antarcticus IMCC3135]
MHRHHINASQEKLEPNDPLHSESAFLSGLESIQRGHERIMKSAMLTELNSTQTSEPPGLFRQLLMRPGSAFGLMLIAIIVLCALTAEYITPFDPNDQPFDGLTIEGAPIAPSAEHWMGTDLLGRDLFSRLIVGAQTSLIIGVVANGLSAILGTAVGVAAGYFGGLTAAVLMRFTDLMMAFPALLLAIVLAAIFEPSLWIVAMVIAMVNWVQMARVVYTETRSLTERDFIQAQISMGSGPMRVLLKHVLPHLLSSIVVFSTLGISTTVLLEATLSYLGVGVQPPTPSWGNIIFENQTYFTSAPWLVFIPGAAILLMALAFNLVGDALRDILDPTLKGRHG